MSLLRLSLPLQKYHLHKLFNNLVWHPVTRKSLLQLLMSLLRMPLSADEAEGSFHGKAHRPLPRPSPAPSLAAALRASTLLLIWAPSVSVQRSGSLIIRWRWVRVEKWVLHDCAAWSLE